MTDVLLSHAVMPGDSITNIWKKLAQRWSHLVFGDHYQRFSPKVRMFRLVEEIFELAQAEGVTEKELDIIKRQVYDKLPGEADQEFGGVMVTLVSYAATAGRDLEGAFMNEFMRIMDPAIMEKVRRRNLEGDKIGMRHHA